MSKEQVHHSVPTDLLAEPGAEFIYNTKLQTAFFISAAAHILLVLAIGFAVPKVISALKTDNTLEVVILNESNNIENEDANIIAQVDNVGGGDSEKEATTNILTKSQKEDDQEQLALKSRKLITVENISEEFLTAKGEAEVPTPKENEPQKEQSQSQQEIDTLEQIRLEKKRIAARFADSISDFQKRPKKEYFAPDTKRSASAAYQVELIEKINRVGNSNFPTEIRNKKISGTLIADLALNRNGTINAIKITNSSGNPLLDATAKKFIRLASPFKPLEDSMLENKNTKIVHITRSYVFTPKSVKVIAVKKNKK